VLQQVNGTRAGMHGLNGTKIPDGNVTVNKNGSLTVETAGGGKYGLRANGMLDYCGNQSSSVSFHPNGSIHAVHTPSVDVNRGVRGNRTITNRMADKSTLVSTGVDRGYLQRDVTVGDQSFAQRIYTFSGKLSNRLYARYTHLGAEMLNYKSAQYYPTEFYAWAATPWDSPVPYQWAWTDDTWYSSASSYFTPNSQYNNASEWVTDYVLAQLISLATTREKTDADQAPDDANQTTETAIAPELKAALAEETLRYIQYETAAAGGTAPVWLPLGRTFILGSDMDFTWADESACSLSEGDIVQLPGPASNDGARFQATIMSNRKNDCLAGKTVNFTFAQLQGFVNTLRGQIDAGLDQLRTEQGQNGLPAAPEVAMGPARPVAPALPADFGPKLGGMLSGLRVEAGRTESSIVPTMCPSQPASQQ
jgi:hypothetical protein